jgi:hypothetical protein
MVMQRKFGSTSICCNDNMSFALKALEPREMQIEAQFLSWLLPQVLRERAAPIIDTPAHRVEYGNAEIGPPTRQANSDLSHRRKYAAL